MPHLSDRLKPLPSEAIARLRTNTVGLVGVTVLTNLLPVPSLWTSLDVVWRRRPSGTIYYAACTLELLVLVVLAFNILHAAYALKYPRTPLPPRAVPSTPRAKAPSSAARQWRLSTLTPNASPQPQKPFSSYVPSPASTPSRTLNYSIPGSATPLDNSFASSLGSVPGSPSSPLAAYRGRHNASTMGRAFDGALLSRLRDASDDDDDDD